MKVIEVTAKKVPDAIEQGLKELGVTLDDVTVEVIEQGGLFKKAKVRITVDEPDKPEAPKSADKPVKSDKSEKSDKAEKAGKPEKKNADQSKPAPVSDAAKPAKPSSRPAPAEKSEDRGQSDGLAADDTPAAPKKRAASDAQKPNKKKEPRPAVAQKPLSERSAEDKAAVEQARAFITALVEKMGFEATVEQNADNAEKIEITAPQGDDSLIIGRHGETLSAIQYLAETGARAEKRHINIVVDCNGYRDRRAASLTAMARRKADDCVRRNRKIKLEPMERIDRRTVHFALGDDDRVATASEGKEPHRCVVIFPKR